MSQQIENNSPHSSATLGIGDAHIADILVPLARQKKIVIVTPLVTAALALALGWQIRPTFESSAAILPPQQQQSGLASMLGQLGSLAGAAGGIGALKNPNDLYVGMLQSRTIADNLIKKFDLKKRYDAETMDETRLKLQKKRDFASGKDGLITIRTEDYDPKFAADLANAYVEELANITKGLAITEASRRRLFFEKQLISAKDDLANAEIALKKTQESTGLLELQGQVKGIIANEAQLQGLIAAKQVQMQSMRSFATANNPEYVRLQEELRALNTQLAKLQKGKSSDGDLMVPTGKLPEVGLAYIRSVRDVKYYETIFELLSKQFELAKIDEARDSSTIQQLDIAVPAEKKSKPKRSMFALLGLLAGGVIGIVWAYARDAYRNPSQNAASSERWKKLRRAWKA